MYYYEIADLGLHADFLRITDWLLFLKCRQHSCSNAIVWAMKLINGEVSDIRDPSICTEALQNTTYELLDRVPEFVQHFVTFPAIRSGTFEERVRFGRALEADEKLIEEFTHIDPFGENDRLVCNSDIETDYDNF